MPHHVDAVHEPTRERVARSILERGPQTAVALAELLGLTPAAVRRHLDSLESEGMIESRAERPRGPRGRGRPARVFALTDLGRSAFPQAYDELAVTALGYLRENGGEEAVTEFARYLAAQSEERYRAVLAAAGVAVPDGDADAGAKPNSPGTPGTAELAGALSKYGYAASVEPARLGEQLCQHHCPVAHVAEQFPQLCEAETEVFARILGRHVQRLATIAHGDGVCTTHVPDPEAVASTATAGADQPGVTGADQPGAGDDEASPKRQQEPTHDPTRTIRTGRTSS